MNEPYDFIETVRLTEKATLLSEKYNKYVFRVKPRATKLDVKRAVELLFKKTVVSVNTCNYSGKMKRERSASLGQQADWKKAIVTLVSGDKIELA